MRKEKHLPDCLLTADNIRKADPQGDVLVCGQCPNRSDMTGNLATLCVNATRK